MDIRSAARAGDLSALRAAIDRGEDVNSVDKVYSCMCMVQQHTSAGCTLYVYSTDEQAVYTHSFLYRIGVLRCRGQPAMIILTVSESCSHQEPLWIWLSR